MGFVKRVTKAKYEDSSPESLGDELMKQLETSGVKYFFDKSTDAKNISKSDALKSECCNASVSIFYLKLFSYIKHHRTILLRDC